MPFHIFISHKSQDGRIATEIKKVLTRDVRADRVEVFISEEIEAGDDWRFRIEKQLTRTNWLLLLYTGADKNWEWCSREVAIYDGVNRAAIRAQLQDHDDKPSQRTAERERRVICLHHDDQSPPVTIEDRQTVKMTRDRLEPVVKRYYSLIDHDGLAENGRAIERAVTDILHVFGEAARSYEFCEQIKITVPRPGNIKVPLPGTINGSELPSDTVVSGDPGTFTKVIGFAPVRPENVPWPDFFKNVASGVNFAWIKELIQAIPLIRDGSIEQPIQAFHLNVNTRLRFRPALRHVSRSSGKLECDVFFVQDVGGGHLSDLLPDYAKILLPTMRLAYRMRYDLLNVYRGKLPAKNESTAPEGIALRVQIANVFSDILAESRSRTANPTLQVIDAFDGDREHEREARDIINSMSSLWPRYARAMWDALGYDPNRGDWLKDKKARLTKKEIRQLEDTLKYVDKMNGVLLRLGTKRLVERAEVDFPDQSYNVAELAGYAKRPCPSDVSMIVANKKRPGRTRVAGPKLGAGQR